MQCEGVFDHIQIPECPDNGGLVSTEVFDAVLNVSYDCVDEYVRIGFESEDAINDGAGRAIQLRLGLVCAPQDT